MTKSLVILYHKNIANIYKQKWIDKSILSVLNQSYSDFDVWELNYGDDDISYVKVQELNNKSYKFFNVPLDNHIYAMYYLLDKAFSEYDYDVVFNTNLDDYYHPQRFDKQIEMVKYGYDIVFTYWQYIEDVDGIDKIKLAEHCKNPKCQKCGSTNGLIKYFDEKILLDGKYPNNNILADILSQNNNVLCHPSACYTRKLWYMADKNGNLLRYRNEKPYEDMFMWQRILTTKNITVGVVQEPLIYYRIHVNQVSKKQVKLLPPSKRRVGILLVCTGKYVQFCKKVILSIESNFLQDSEKIYFFFSDDEKFVADLAEELKIKHFFTKLNKRGFPADTLYRYNYFLMQKYNLKLHTDIVYYFDVDMRVESINPVDILPTIEKPLIGVRHPGFYLPEKLDGSPETNIHSTAYIKPEKYKKCYIAGGFNGGFTDYFIAMAEDIVKRIDIDDTNEIVAVWHDESHLNKYLNLNFNKFKILESAYCYPESWNIPFTRRILALDKNHDGVRIDDTMYVSPVLEHSIGDKLFSVATSIAYAENIKIAKKKEVNVILPIILTNHQASYRNSIFSSFLRGNINKITWVNKLNIKTIDKQIDIHDKNTMLTGYLDVNYFDKYKDIILESIKLPQNKLDNIHFIYNGICNLFDGSLVSIHIPKEEYLLLLKNPDDKNNYYYKSIQHIEKTVKNPYYMIYLEKPKLTQLPKLLFNLTNMYLLDKKTHHDYMLLFLLSMCKHHILSNTSFGWWVGYLSKNKNTTIFPSNFIHKSLPHWTKL